MEVVWFITLGLFKTSTVFSSLELAWLALVLVHTSSGLKISFSAIPCIQHIYIYTHIYTYIYIYTYEATCMLFWLVPVSKAHNPGHGNKKTGGAVIAISLLCAFFLFLLLGWVCIYMYMCMYICICR